jgi:tetratricopeptide (TPR) repeat protein
LQQQLTSNRRWARGILLACTLALGLGSSARAEVTKTPSKIDIEFAKKYFKLGHQYHKQRKLARALEAFEESYRLSGNATLLHNIGKCYDDLGNARQALVYYRQFLAHTKFPNKEIVMRVKSLELQLAMEGAAKAPQPAKLPGSGTKGEPSSGVKSKNRRR